MAVLVSIFGGAGASVGLDKLINFCKKKAGNSHETYLKVVNDTPDRIKIIISGVDNYDWWVFSNNMISPFDQVGTQKIVKFFLLIDRKKHVFRSLSLTGWIQNFQLNVIGMVLQLRLHVISVKNSKSNLTDCSSNLYSNLQNFWISIILDLLNFRSRLDSSQLKIGFSISSYEFPFSAHLGFVCSF